MKRIHSIIVALWLLCPICYIVLLGIYFVTGNQPPPMVGLINFIGFFGGMFLVVGTAPGAWRRLTDEELKQHRDCFKLKGWEDS